ncbi:hypothetical protein SAMN04487898_115168 [Pedobacter sp. ok626]|uniref:hypothetical protein n=1 Tax=Pedobacter sp. ok626 TaxID=1761882 RepID=UPI000889C417|nr:hypothetical protein [Pedobacter sp. ok626]SDL16631.1 hypothetical protein SAMN04487898_115168 [Pedobacter sp. ok626]
MKSNRTKLKKFGLCDIETKSVDLKLSSFIKKSQSEQNEQTTEPTAFLGLARLNSTRFNPGTYE